MILMIVIENLTKKFDEDTNLHFNNLTFEDNKSYAIIGPSGCGKSTLLNLISGIIKPDTGKIIITPTENNPFIISKFNQKQKDAFRFNHIGYIFQDYKLIEEFSVIDNLELLNLNGKKYSEKDFNVILERVQLLHKKKQKVKTLSGGEKQRVAIARALIKKSNIVLADEPTESLNEELSHEIVELLTRLSKEDNKTVIMVTHDTSLTKYFDKVINVTELFNKEGI
jgi:putative ABC transport system ATP-binding protein